MLKLWNPSRPRKFWWDWVGGKNSSDCSNAYPQKRPQLLDSPLHSHFWLVWGNHMWAGRWVSISWRVHHTRKCRDCWTWQRRWDKGLLVPYCQTHTQELECLISVLALLVISCVTLGKWQTLRASVSSRIVPTSQATVRSKCINTCEVLRMVSSTL